MQLTECRTRKFSPNVNRPPVWLGGMEMELPVLRTHNSALHISNFVFVSYRPLHLPHPIGNISIFHITYMISYIGIYCACKFSNCAISALPRASRHPRNGNLRISNPTSYHLAHHPANPSFQHMTQSNIHRIYTR